MAILTSQEHSAEWVSHAQRCVEGGEGTMIQPGSLTTTHNTYNSSHGDFQSAFSAVGDAWLSQSRWQLMGSLNPTV